LNTEVLILTYLVVDKNLVSCAVGNNMIIRTEKDAIELFKSAIFVLRYNSTPAIPLLAMYDLAENQRIAVELTNRLLGRGDVIETNVIASRLVLVYCDMIPALLALRTRHRTKKLSSGAERAFALIKSRGTATSGDVRRAFGLDGKKRPDAADEALSELQREMLIDRGPSSVPQNGIPYLSKEGYPYRVFEAAHKDLVKISKAIPAEKAIQAIVTAMGATPLRKVASMFKLCFTSEELKASQYGSA
jgi:hypothetical protein